MSEESSSSSPSSQDNPASNMQKDKQTDRLEDYANTRNVEVTIQDIRNPSDNLRRAYHDINTHKPYNHQICLAIMENESRPMLTVYSLQYNKFYGITNIIREKKENQSVDQLQAVEIHGKVSHWLPIYTELEYANTLQKILEDPKYKQEEAKLLKHYEDNRDAYYNKTNNNTSNHEIPDHNQTCLLVIEITKKDNTQTHIPILAIYDAKDQEFLAIEEIHKHKSGRYHTQHVECHKIPGDIAEKSIRWLPVFTAFEFYKYDQSERTKWRKTLVQKLKKENPYWSKTQTLKELNKIKPFPQIIRNLYETDMHKGTDEKKT